MTIGELKQWLIDNNVPDDAEISVTEDSKKISEIDYLAYSNIVEII